MGRSIYQVTVTCDDEPNYGRKHHTSLAKPNFKKRFANHKWSFANERYEKKTELSKEIWSLKRKKLHAEDHMENSETMPTIQSGFIEMLVMHQREVGDRNIP